VAARAERRHSLESQLARRARSARECPTQEAGELVAEQAFEARSCGASLSADHALEGGAMLEKFRGSMLVPAAAEACGGHARIIGVRSPAHDPWRE
jgi:hypothetical protein